MKLSCNEIAALCTKAARGAGLPLGHAEDIGQAGVWLAASGGLASLCHALQAPGQPCAPTGNCYRNARVAMNGPTAIDLVAAGAPQVTLTNPDAPDLMRALCAAANLRVKDTPGGLLISQDLNPAASRPTGPIEVAQSTLDQLHRFAARTYVPETEASRLSGAGAGLTDND